MIKTITKLRFVYIVALAAGPLLTHAMTLKSMEVQQELNSANQKLLTAVQSEDLEAAEAAIKAGADVNHVDGCFTALLIAIIKESADMARLLLEHGARMLTEENIDKFASSLAISIHKTLRSIFETNQLAYATAQGNTRRVTQLLSTIPQAVVIENIAMQGQAQSQSPQAQSLLKKVTNWLASYGLLRPSVPTQVDINRQDTHGMTALHWAAAQGQADITRDLLGAGANFRLTDTEGLTPYGLAERNRNEMTRTGNPKEAQRFQQVMDAITDYLTRGTAEMALESAFRQLTQKGQATGTAPAELIQMIIQQNIPQRPPLGVGTSNP